MRWFLLLVALLALGGCAVNRVSSYPVNGLSEYTLDTGDTVRVTVYGDTIITNTYTVTDKGTLSVPLVGEVPARGETIGTVERAVTKLLAAGYMIAPKVSVEVTAYRPFFIDGAVTKGGQYPYVWGMTARAAVATAEGFKDFADRNRVTIFRRNGHAQLKFSAPVDTPIMPGDTVVVGERWL
jgi:polysaccharide export outer membrane protein